MATTQKQWTVLRRRAWLKVLVVYGLSWLLPAVLVFFLLAGIVIYQAWLPAWLATSVAVAISLAVPIFMAYRFLSRKQHAPITENLLEALDWQRQAHNNAQLAFHYWHQFFHQLAKAWRWPLLGMVIAVCVIGLTTMMFWSIPFRVIAKGGYQDIRNTKNPLVLLSEVIVDAPENFTSQQKTQYPQVQKAGDGFLRVPEGALLTWTVKSLQPAKQMIWLSAATQTTATVDENAVAQFHQVIDHNLDYSFAVAKWGITWQESIKRRIIVEPDQVPEVIWKTKPPETLTDREGFTFQWQAKDDRGLTRVILQVEGAQITKEFELATFSEPVTKTNVLSASFQLSELPPAETVILTIIAQDNRLTKPVNQGKSEPVSMELKTLLQAHHDFVTTLAEFLNRQIHVLADLLALTNDPLATSLLDLPTWRQRLTELMEQSEALAKQAKEQVVASVRSDEKLLEIRQHWQLALTALNKRQLPIVHAEDAAWQTDQLMHNEEAAALEYQQDQLISRVDQIAENIDMASDAELKRMLNMLEQEMQRLQNAMKTQRSQLPTELLQQDALKPAEQKQQENLYEQLQQALAKGDRQKAKEVIAQLSKQLQAAREAMQAGAAAWQDAQDQGSSLQQLSAARKQLQDLQAQQQQLSQATSALSQKIETARQSLFDYFQQRDKETAVANLKTLEQNATQARTPPQNITENKRTAAAWQDLKQGLQDLQHKSKQQAALEQELKDFSAQSDYRNQSMLFAAKKHLEQAQQSMQKASAGMQQKNPSTAAQEGWQASDALKEAIAVVGEQEKRLQQAGNGKGRGSWLANPQAGKGAQGFSSGPQDPMKLAQENSRRQDNRAEILKGFRSGIPTPGKEANERYFERLVQ